MLNAVKYRIVGDTYHVLAQKVGDRVENHVFYYPNTDIKRVLRRITRQNSRRWNSITIDKDAKPPEDNGYSLPPEPSLLYMKITIGT